MRLKIQTIMKKIGDYEVQLCALCEPPRLCEVKTRTANSQNPAQPLTPYTAPAQSESPCGNAQA